MTNFGYARITTTGTTGHPATVVGWAFNQVGHPITIPGDGGEGCDAPTDVPWLSSDPTSGTTPPADSVPVDVTVDASGLDPGDYLAQLCVTTNDPGAPLMEIPVGLTVTPSGDDPVIGVDPNSLESTLPEGGTETQDLTISNLGDGTLDWQVTESPAAGRVLRAVGRSSGPSRDEASAAAGSSKRPQALRSAARPRDAVGSRPTELTQAAGIDRPRRVSHPFPQPFDEVTITHSESLDILSPNTVACSPDDGVTTTDNQFLRTFVLEDFDITEAFTVSEVTFGVQMVRDFTPVIEVNLYTLEGDFTYDNLTPIGNATVTLEPQELTLVTVPVTGAAPAGSTLVVEIAAPDLSGVGAFFPGSNNLGETAPSYIASDSCSTFDPVAFADIGFPDVHLVMTVTGETETGGGDCALPDWVSVEPTSGSVPGDGEQVVEVTFDATGLEEGTREANLCLASNDPEQPLIQVPLTLTVTGGGGGEENETVLVSRASGADGVKGNQPSLAAAISADGRFVAFYSAANNLDPNDTGGIDVFVRDLETDETILVSRASGADGVKGNGTSDEPAISADGRYVAFTSEATNLHPDDTDDLSDVFVRDLQTGETILVSRASGADGVKGDDESNEPAISADGRFVAFRSWAANLHPDDADDFTDMFVRDLETDETILVSRASGADGVDANDHAGLPAISADGRFVAFRSVATNLHPDDTDDLLDVFVRDLETGETILVSRASGADGVKGNQPSLDAAISADGRFVAFRSDATNLHPDDFDGFSDVFVRDLEMGETILVSRASGADGVKGNEPSLQPAISADGRFVAFDSNATNLHPDDTDVARDVFVRDVLGPQEQVIMQPAPQRAR